MGSVECWLGGNVDVWRAVGSKGFSHTPAACTAARSCSNVLSSIVTVYSHHLQGCVVRVVCSARPRLQCMQEAPCPKGNMHGGTT
jgi:hypothetical protein